MRQRNSLAELFDTLMSDSFNPYAVDRNVCCSRPALNIMETADEFRVQYAAPGMTREDAEVKLDEDQRLQVTIGRTEEKVQTENAVAENESAVAKTEDTPRYLRREFSRTSFTQKLNLPEDIDLDRISATMENGLLEISIPKRTEEQKAKLQRTIAIS